jgi:hypothetical protein
MDKWLSCGASASPLIVLSYINPLSRQNFNYDGHSQTTFALKSPQGARPILVLPITRLPPTLRRVGTGYLTECIRHILIVPLALPRFPQKANRGLALLMITSEAHYRPPSLQRRSLVLHETARDS